MVLAAAALERAMKIQEVSMRALSGAITWLQAVDILGLDRRSVRRWRARYQAGGRVALYDRRCLRPSRRKAAPWPTSTSSASRPTPPGPRAQRAAQMQHRQADRRFSTDDTPGA